MEKVNNCREIMRKIRETDFAMLETALFLDAYPECKRAMEYYSEQKKKNDALRKQYNATCGPLTIYSNENTSEWEWVKRPWPWEYNSD